MDHFSHDGRNRRGVRKTFIATDAKNRFGALLDSAQAGPAAIQKNGRDVAVLISAYEYKRLHEGKPPSTTPVLVP